MTASAGDPMIYGRYPAGETSRRMDHGRAIAALDRRNYAGHSSLGSLRIKIGWDGFPLAAGCLLGDSTRDINTGARNL